MCRLCVLLVLVGFVSNAAAQSGRDLFLPELTGVALDGPGIGPNAVTVLRQRLVRVDHEILATARLHAARPATQPTVLLLNLFDDVVLRAAIDATGPTSAGYSLSGQIEGEPLSSVTLVVNGEVIAGTVRTLARTVTVTTVGRDDVVAIREIDPASQRFHEVVDDPGPSTSRKPQSPWPIREPTSDTQRPPGGVAAAGATAAAEMRGGSEDGSRVDVLVVYTPIAREQAGGVEDVQALIDLRVAETNQAFANSGVIARIHLAHTAEVDYTEVPRALDPAGRNTIEHLIDPSDGYMDEVHVLRDRYAADLVHLIVDNRYNTGGEAKRLRDLSSLEDAAARNAFTITKAHPGSGSVIFAHELGHSMGLAHDRYAEIHVCCSGLNKVYPYSHGYVNQQAFEPDAPRESYWRTIMSYPSQCDVDARLYNMCVPVLRFSNPDLTLSLSSDLPGDPMGVPGDEPSVEITGPADARRSLNETHRFVANFRVAPRNVESDRAALVALYNATGGPNWTNNTNWLSDEPLGDWHGVTTDGDGRVEHLRLVDNALSGPVPTELGNLANLEWLSLWDNQLSGPIPAWIGNLADISYLNLSRNRLSGPVPSSLGNLTNLRGLYLYANPLTGPLPQSLTQLPLQWFWSHFTQTCAPSDAAFQAWVGTIRSRGPGNFRGTTCGQERTGSFIDPTLAPGATGVRVGHVTELRQLVNTVRAVCELPHATWTDSPIRVGETPVRAGHLTELRTALSEAFTACLLPSPTYTDPVIMRGVTPVKAVHWTELRAAGIRALGATAP